jgi:hypothetical protein
MRESPKIEIGSAPRSDIVAPAGRAVAETITGEGVATPNE